MLARKRDEVHVSPRYRLIVLADPYPVWSARGGLGGARVVSRPGVFFFFAQFVFGSQVSILTYRYIMVWMHVRKEMAQQIVLFPCVVHVGGSNHEEAW